MENASPVVFRLSPLQKTLWSNPELRGSHVYALAELRGALKVDALKDAFTRLAEQHESLRTVFQVSPGFTFPFQVVQDLPNFTWEVTEGPDTQDEGLLDPANWVAATPFDGPTFGVKLVRVATDEYALGMRALALCCDHESLLKMLAEVMVLYGGQTSELAVQYADFSEWHNEAVGTASEDADAAKEFWEQTPSGMMLPLKSRVAAAGSGARERFAFSVDAGALGKSHEEAEKRLLAAWQALLWRLTDAENVSVDVLRSGRPLADLELSVGLYARPFPVAATFDAASTFADAEAQAAAALAAVERWQAYQQAEPAGSVGFEYIALPEALESGELRLRVRELQPLRWSAKLTLSCVASGEGTRVELVYDPAQYSAEDVWRIAEYYSRVVRAASGESRLADVELLDEAERKQITESFNATGVDFGEMRTFPELFEAQAALTPDRTALVHEGTSLTYAQLNARANQIASWLRKAGVGPNAAVGLCLERSAEMIVALLGILKAGGAYVPLLPDLPQNRLMHQIAETGTKVIVTVQALAERLAGFEGTLLALDASGEVLTREPEENLSHGAGPKDRAYVLYTSGSTGTPKGVAVRHDNLTNYVHGITRLLGLKELSTDKGLTFATVSTLGADLGNTAIYPPLVTGGCLVVIGYEAAIDGGLFAQRFAEHPMDVLKITPSNLNALLAGGVAEKVLPRKFLITGGEACTWDLVERVRAAGTCRIVNHYGPTETTIGCLTYDLQAESGVETTGAAIVPLGRPLPNVRAYVVDRALRPVPVGVPGEICVAGAGVTDGYVGRPEETRTKFVADPIHGGLMYRTGDRARMLAEGSIEFLGRVDDQVKIRGYRVELGEIEAVVEQYPGVQQAAVLLSQESGTDSLAAYVISAEEVASADLQRFMREHLPDYMVPRDFIKLEQFPLNANGKLDRKKLSAIKPGAAPVASDYIAPRTELEEQLAGIWKETLQCERVGMRDNFFDLGGHSLLATQIISRIRGTLGLNVSIRMLFEAPTVESLATAVETMRVEETDDSELSDLLAELEGMSDDEAEKILGSGSSS